MKSTTQETPLRIGFASIYAWRPHTEHMIFLAQLLERAGHRVFYLACDSDVATCYTRELRDTRPGWAECLACRLGGVRSYPVYGVTSIGDFKQSSRIATAAQARGWAASSASTLGRFESEADFWSADFLSQRSRLEAPVAVAYGAARAWIARERLDAVVVFNGRIDLTRAIYEAAKSEGARVVSFERTWFGDGIQLLPEENCLGLETIHRLIGDWRSKPLTHAQARTAASYVAERLASSNTKEWRAYNTYAEPRDWPVPDGRHRILLLPGSLNEVWGDPGWSGDWPNTAAAYDALIAHLRLQPSDLVLRCHPNWGERIGKNDGHRAEEHYTQWAQSRGIHVIASNDRTSTMSLIAQCEAVGLGSSSAAVEAAALGKQVIATSPSSYRDAGFCSHATSREQLCQLVLHSRLAKDQQTLVQDSLRRQVLRYLYTMIHRIPQYVEYVKSVSTTSYDYAPGAAPDRLVQLIRSGVLQPDDVTHSNNEHGEDLIMEHMKSGDWEALRTTGATTRLACGTGPKRRWFLRPIDVVREKMPVGDR